MQSQIDGLERDDVFTKNVVVETKGQHTDLPPPGSEGIRSRYQGRPVELFDLYVWVFLYDVGVIKIKAPTQAIEVSPGNGQSRQQHGEQRNKFESGICRRH